MTLDLSRKIRWKISILKTHDTHTDENTEAHPYLWFCIFINGSVAVLNLRRKKNFSMQHFSNTITHSFALVFGNKYTHKMCLVNCDQIARHRCRKYSKEKPTQNNHRIDRWKDVILAPYSRHRLLNHINQTDRHI